MLYLCQNARSQTTAFQKTADALNGFTLHIGASQSRFLNPRFAKNLENGVLKMTAGFTIGMTYVRYPLAFNCTYLNSRMKVSEYDWAYPADTKINHKGMEFGLTCMLLPQVKRLQPFIGAGYHLAAVGVGIDQSSDEAKLEKSAAGLNGIVGRAGLAFYMGKGFGLLGEYQRPLKLNDNEKAFNRIALCLTMNLSKYYNPRF